MRTTLDIDDDLLAAAKELARRERKSAGQVVSELMRKGLTGAGRELPIASERASSAESEPSSRAWLERTWIMETRPSASGPSRSTTAATRNSGRSSRSKMSTDLLSHLSG